MHRHNALARALNDSTCLSPETAAQRVPYATARVSGLGGDVQVKLAAVRELIPKLEQERRHLGLPWEDLERIDALLGKSYEALDKLSKQLAELDTGRGYRGRPDLYRVSVPALSYGGGMEGEQAAECWTLNTHDLPEDVRAWLTGYLLSGAKMLPYRYQAQVHRYKAQSAASAELRAMIKAIWECRQAVPLEKNAPIEQPSCVASCIPG